MGIRFDRVVSIEPAGVHMTYDISMPDPHHNYLANEFVVHNSYNEQSGRYTEMTPEFYIPPNSRKIVQVGKTGHYEFVDGDDEQWATVDIELEMQSRAAWRGYQTMLKKGVAKEVARMALPLNIYSRAYVTMNLRGLLNFLSLRTRSALSTYPSFPQEEIAWVADKMELSAYGVVPITMGLFNENGRVCP